MVIQLGRLGDYTVRFGEFSTTGLIGLDIKTSIRNYEYMSLMYSHETREFTLTTPHNIYPNIQIHVSFLQIPKRKNSRTYEVILSHFSYFILVHIYFALGFSRVRDDGMVSTAFKKGVNFFHVLIVT